MKKDNLPKLVLSPNLWSFHKFPYQEEHPDWPLEKIADAFRAHGIHALSWPPQLNQRLGAWVKDNGFRFGGALDFTTGDDPIAKIEMQLAIGDGPINCQLCDHDTSTEEAVEAAIIIMEASKKLGANVHIEAHRDTSTETPEKMDAIIDGYLRQTGKRLKVNFDHSHPAIIKHLLPKDFSSRLITRPDYLQESDLLHCRPFNGHHCQIPVTDGKGQLSPECENYLVFVFDLFTSWLQGPHVEGRELWVVPELGPYDTLGYGLSCFPDIGSDVFVLAKELEKTWARALESLSD